MSSYSKITAYKINIWKPITFLYIRNEQLEFEILKNAIYVSTLKNKMLRYKSNKMVTDIKKINGEYLMFMNRNWILFKWSVLPN